MQKMHAIMVKAYQEPAKVKTPKTKRACQHALGVLLAAAIAVRTLALNAAIEEKAMASFKSAVNSLDQRKLDALYQLARKRNRDAETLIALKAQRGNPTAKAMIADLFSSYVNFFAFKYSNGRSVLSEDLVSHGYLGLMKALKEFSPDNGNTFFTYAIHCIKNEIRHGKREIRAQQSMRQIKEQDVAALVVEAHSHLSMSFGREPTYEEVAARMRNIKPKYSWTSEAVRDILEGRAASCLKSGLKGNYDDWLHDLSDRGVDRDFETMILRASYGKYLGCLDEVERNVLLRRLRGESFPQIAQACNLTQKIARHKYETAVGKIRSEINFERLRLFARGIDPASLDEEIKEEKRPNMGMREFLLAASDRQLKIIGGLRLKIKVREITKDLRVSQSSISVEKSHIGEIVGQAVFEDFINTQTGAGPTEDAGAMGWFWVIKGWYKRLPDGAIRLSRPDWTKPDNRKQAICSLAKLLGKDPRDLIGEDFESNMLGGLSDYYYRGKPYNAATEAFPEQKIQPWEMAITPNGFFSIAENRIAAVRWLAKKLRKKPKYLSGVDFKNNRLGGLLSVKYRDSPYAAVTEAFPELNIQPWEMSVTPTGFYDRLENRVGAIKWLVKKLRKNPKNVTQRDFHKNGLGGLLSNMHNNSPYEALLEAGFVTQRDEEHMRKRNKRSQSRFEALKAA